VAATSLTNTSFFLLKVFFISSNLLLYIFIFFIVFVKAVLAFVNSLLPIFARYKSNLCKSSFLRNTKRMSSIFDKSAPLIHNASIKILFLTTYLS